MGGINFGGLGGGYPSRYGSSSTTPRYGNSSNQVGKTSTPPKKKKKTGAGIEVSPSSSVKSRYGV